jgi:hypothetical protein
MNFNKVPEQSAANLQRDDRLEEEGFGRSERLHAELDAVRWLPGGPHRH